MCCEMGEFRALRIQYIILHCEKMRNYITYDITFELQKLKGGPPLRCRDAHFATQGLDRGVVRWININTDLFVLNFYIHFIYIHNSPPLQF
jgi:hypothetical protein